MKKTKKVLLNLILGILVFCISSNVYAVDRCIYEGEWGTLTITNSLDVINELIQNYSPNYPDIKYESKDNLYAFIDHTNTSGKKQVYFKNVQYSMSAQITATSYYNNFDKRAFKTDEWKNVFDQNTDTLKCADLYFNTDFEDKLGTANDTNVYRFSPTSDNGEYGFKVSASNVEPEQEPEVIPSANDPVLTECSREQKNEIEKQLTQLEKDMESELKALNSYWFDPNTGYAREYNEQTKNIFEHLLSETSPDVYSNRINDIVSNYNMKIYNAIKNGGCEFDDAYWNKYKKNFSYAVERWSSIIKSNFDQRINNAAEKGTIGKQTAEDYKQSTINRKAETKEFVDHIIDSMSNWYDVLAHGKVLTCTGLLDSELVEIIKKVLNWLRILVPILVIVLSTVDFGKAVLNEDKDELKQAFTRFVKRLIVAVIIFFVPTIINALINIINDPSKSIIVDLPDGTKIQTLTDCGIK